jgi:hypothetical protein
VSLEGPQRAAAALNGAQQSAARRIPKLDRIVRDGSRRFRGCQHYFPCPPWLSYAALPRPHGIDAAARGRKIDIYFLLIKIQTMFNILSIRIVLRHEPRPLPSHDVTHRSATDALESASGRDDGWNTAKKRAIARKDLEKRFFGLRPSQPLEIPQNRQSFLWKCLEKTSGDLEKLGKKLGGSPLFRHLCPSRNAAAPVSKWRTTPSRRAPSNRGADRAHFDRDRLIKSPLTGMIQVVAIRPTASQSRTGV